MTGIAWRCTGVGLFSLSCAMLRSSRLETRGASWLKDCSGSGTSRPVARTATLSYASMNSSSSLKMGGLRARGGGANSGRSRLASGVDSSEAGDASSGSGAATLGFGRWAGKRMGEDGAPEAEPPSFLMYPLVTTPLVDGALVDAP
jgi:hypothetical protein